MDLHRVVTTSHKHAFAFTPSSDDLELVQRQRWTRGADHHLLMELISLGRLPLAWPDAGGPDKAPHLSEAMRTARWLGYNVPEDFITNSSEPSYSEREAFHAAHMIARGHFNAFNSGDGISDLQGFRRSLCQLTGQFIVPDPLQPNKTPYFLDQLWVIANPDQTVRLIAIEIDGEVHLPEEEQLKSHKRDHMLAAMGYEVVHVAGWWCRIDPYRAILTALACVGLLSVAHADVPGAEFCSIGDYRCGLCNKPMVRWDVDWIKRTSDGDRNLCVHRCCYQTKA